MSSYEYNALQAVWFSLSSKILALEHALKPQEYRLYMDQAQTIMQKKKTPGLEEDLQADAEAAAVQVQKILNELMPLREEKAAIEAKIEEIEAAARQHFM